MSAKEIAFGNLNFIIASIWCKEFIFALFSLKCWWICYLCVFDIRTFLLLFSIENVREFWVYVYFIEGLQNLSAYHLKDGIAFMCIISKAYNFSLFPLKCFWIWWLWAFVARKSFLLFFIENWVNLVFLCAFWCNLHILLFTIAKVVGFGVFVSFMQAL